MATAQILRTIAVAGGSGNLGTYLVDALRHPDHHFEVSVLTRRASNSSPTKPALPPGVKCKEVDYAVQHELVAAIEGVDVVIAALTMPEAQMQMIQAVKAVGTVKLLYGFDFSNRSVTLVGKGEASISFTTRADVGRFLAHHLATAYASSSNLPSPVQAEILRIEGDRKTLEQAVEAYERSHPQVGQEKGALRISYTPLSAAVATSKDLSGNFYASLVAYCLAVAEKGGCCVADAEGNTDGTRWEEWMPKGVDEAMAEME
ncbi:hypothetical protein JCM11251_001578 [Rhodosporidiobolus azoricus]